ncbi:retrovirus-related Pol polyprotein from transposon 297 [Trichonephila clavipes]|nr:retrovirus-related Pol polyprotein from transposon 297 [Trichonephila clavipes]
MSNADDNRRNWRNSEVVRRTSNSRNDYRGNYENGRQGNQWFNSKNRFLKDDRRFNDREYQFINGSQKDDFSRGDRRNRGSSENFSRGDRRQRGRLNVLKVSDDQNDQTQSANEVPIYLSAICMSPVELPYVPILFNDIFTKALWDTGVEKSFISEEIYRKYFFYKQVKKSRAQVITAQGAKCQNVGIVELNVRIREFILNSITKYSRYPLRLIDNLLMNIPHTTITSTLDLRSGYFQLAVNPRDIVKTTFVTKNGTYTFRRMPFGLSGAAPNFQKAIDILLKPVIGKFVNVYMDDVIISSPSFTHHIEHLREVFRLLQDAGITLNKDKCKFGCDELKYLGLIISKEGIKTDETKVRVIVEMKPPRNSKEVSKFLGMSQRYTKFLKNYADLSEPIYNFKRKLKKFRWSIEAQKASTLSSYLRMQVQ